MRALSPHVSGVQVIVLNWYPNEIQEQKIKEKIEQKTITWYFRCIFLGFNGKD